MQFDDIISRFLCEDTPEREERIKALKSIVRPGEPGTLMYDVERLKSFNLSLFPRVTSQDLINEEWGEYSIVFEMFNVLFEVQYDRGEINVYNDYDTDIEDWNVVNIFANLRPIAGENYFVVLDKNTVPNLYESLIDTAYDEVINRYLNPRRRTPSFT